MARARYIPGALVEARNSKIWKGASGLFLQGPLWIQRRQARYRDLPNEQAWFKVHWFEKPGNVDSYSWMLPRATADRLICPRTRLNW